MDERKLSRRLSRLRVAHDIAHLNDFLAPDFAPADLVEKLAKTCSLGSQVPTQGHTSQKQEDSLGGIDLLLSACIDLEGRLCELEEEVGEANDSLRMQLSTDHGGYESKIVSTEKELEKLKGSLDQIQVHSDELMSFGKKVGTWLVDIRKRKDKALNVADILDHVNIFAQCRDLSTLPACFHDDGELEKSAKMVSLLIGTLAEILDQESIQKETNAQPGTLKVLADAIREEASVLEQLFEESEKAISLFITRIFEEIVSKMISLAFQFAKFGQEKDSRMLRDSLRLIAESYRKTLNLADEACQMIRTRNEQQLSPVNLADGAMGTILVHYPALEKKWIIALGTSTVSQANKDDFNVETAMSLIAINEESLKRCIQILAPNERTEFVQELFYTPVLDEMNSGPSMSSLLDYLGAFIIDNLDRAKAKHIRLLDMATFWRDADTKPVVVQRGIQGSIGMLLQSVSVAVQCIQAAQTHFRQSIEPIIRLHSESCEDALKELEKAIELQISINLEGCQQKFVDKVMEMLSHSQSKADFNVDSANTNEIESPTQACLKASLIMKEMIAICGNGLKGKNLEIFLGQLARRLETSIEMHVLKYCYTPSGALRMRRDLGEYSACLEDPSNPSRQPPLQDLRAMSNILIVGPSSVQEMIHSVSYLGKLRIKKLLERRYDYKSLPPDLLNSL
eukprot:jgi/Picsp_1/1417/NSC_04896-R1_exocyst complex component 5